MEELFENILGRLEELQNNLLSQTEGDINLQVGIINGVMYSKKIVKEVAEEYKDGWIACSEMLPEEHKLYDITFKNSAGIHSDSAIYNPYLKRWLWDADETELVENEILAWAEKREPYQTKGE